MKPTAIVTGCLLSLLAGCKDAGEPPNPFDSQLLGEWYYFDTLMIAEPGPAVMVQGRRISPNGAVYSLGIETATGKVSLMSTEPIGELLVGNEGVFIIRYFHGAEAPPDTSHYRTEADILVLGNTYGEYATFHRTHLGFVLRDPIQSDVSVTIDSSEFRNPTVASSVPAYVSKWPSSGFRLWADISNGRLLIDINPFNGPGTYAIAPQSGYLWQVSGDVVLMFTTDSVATGTVTVDSFDETSHRSSGRFAYGVRSGTLVHQLRDGTFSVPLFE